MQRQQTKQTGGPNRQAAIRAARRRAAERLEAKRRGSTILIVVSFLAMLMFLGVFFFSLSSKEEITAEYNADAAKVREDPGLGPDVYFNFALRQLIVGPRQGTVGDPNNPGEYQSALYGGRMSLIPQMMGRDMSPGNGQGIHAILNGTPPTVPNPVPVVDQDYDGSADAGGQVLLDVNASLSAGATPHVAGFPEPDSGYTYPDINSPFLGYYAQAVRANGTPFDFVIPSFLLPGYLRNVAAPGQWYTDPATKNRVLRPHRGHMAVAADGTISTTHPRFIHPSEGDPHGIGNFPFPAPQAGVWTGNGTTIDLDADPDNNGTEDAILVDLDFPMQTRADGTNYVPIFSFKIVDAESRIPLNTGGNLAGDANLANNPYGNNDFVSRSNDGVSGSEINPAWALSIANPAAASAGDLDQYNIFFGHFPADRLELANMNDLFLKIGRPEFSAAPRSLANVTDIYPGLYGDTERLKNVVSTFPSDVTQFPLPGISGADDNSNALAGWAFTGANTGGVFPNFVQFPAPIHPLSYRGSGLREFQNTGAGNRLQPRLLSSGIGPHRYLNYDGYHTNNTLQYFSQSVPAALRSQLVSNRISPDQLIDEPEEMIYDPKRAQSVDALFAHSEDAALRYSSTDRSATGTSGRISQLAPYGFDINPSAAEVRKRFATNGWDLMFHRATRWGGTGATKFRGWEWSPVPSTSPQQWEFPPRIVASGTPDPMRPVLRSLLRVRTGGTPSQQIRRLQRRLSVNHVLDRAPDGRLRFRPLTPHVTSGLPKEPIGALSIRRPEQITNNTQQEFLARRDRQMLCRDLFTLMYLFGGGRDDRNYATATPAYTPQQLRDMAQFCVNLVDRLDHDDVMTKFEYDLNFADGYNPNDNPYTPPGPNEGPGNVGVVTGIEGGRRLTLSEALVVLHKRVLDMGNPVNHEATLVDDSEHHDYTYVELRNPTTFPVSFNNEAWQIRITPRPNNATSAATIEERRLTLRNGGVGTGGSGGGGTGSIFAVGSAGKWEPDPVMPSNPLPSFVSVDPSWTAATMTPNYQVIAPGGKIDLDLIDYPNQNGTAAANDYRISQDSGGAPGDGATVDPNTFGDWLHWVNDTPGNLDSVANVPIRVELYRRLHLDREPPVVREANPVQHRQQSRDNPWIKVDEMDFEIKPFSLQKSTSATSTPSITDELRKLTSEERSEPYTRSIAGQREHAAAIKANSVGQTNSNTPAGFRVHETHFNREFASVVELFAVGIYPPEELTRLKGYNPNNPNGLPKMSDRFTAGRLFLDPATEFGYDYTQQPTPVPDNNEGNRWLRLLDFVEVPAKTHRQFENSGVTIDMGLEGNQAGRQPVGGYRVPGRMNLNTTAYPSGLGALLDDRRVIDIDHANPGDANYLVDQRGENRDWWTQFLRARDRRDPITGHVLPGVPGVSRPFRPLNFNAEGTNSIQHTILRTLPKDPLASNPRKLFELGRKGEHDNSTVDYVTKHRMLSKVYNNVTTQSNVFQVFIEVKFFEAVEVTDGSGRTYVRVGAELGDQPPHRGFFVIDRSRAFELLQPSDLPPDPNATSDPTFSFNQNFDFHQLIMFREVIE